MEEVDYLVIGAGIAGMTFYHYLQSDSVVIVDSKPGRYKIGESIVPPHFFEPELRPVLEEARKLPSAADKLGTLFVTAEGVSFFHSYYDAAFTIHLDRRELEQLYREHFDIPVRHERVEAIDFATKVVTTDRRQYRVRKQIVDCSGPAMVVARKLEITREVWPVWASWLYLDVEQQMDERYWQELRASAVPFYRYSDLTQDVGAADIDTALKPSHMTMLTRIQDGVWNWQIPLYRSSLLSFGLVSRHGPVSDEELLQCAQERVGRQYRAKLRLQASENPHDKIHRRNRFAHAAESFASPDWVLIGDAGFFGDPVYSVGTGIATNQAIRAASLMNRYPWEDKAWRVFDQKTRALFDRAKQAYQHWYDGTVTTADDVASDVQADFLNGLAFHCQTGQAYIDMCSIAGPENDSDPRYEGDGGDDLTTALPEIFYQVLGWRVTRAAARNGSLELDWLGDGGEAWRMLVARRESDQRCFRAAGPFALSYQARSGSGDAPRSMTVGGERLFEAFASIAVQNQGAVLRLLELRSNASDVAALDRGSRAGSAV